MIVTYIEHGIKSEPRPAAIAIEGAKEVDYDGASLVVEVGLLEVLINPGDLGLQIVVNQGRQKLIEVSQEGTLAIETTPEEDGGPFRTTFALTNDGPVQTA